MAPNHDPNQAGSHLALLTLPPLMLMDSARNCLALFISVGVSLACLCGEAVAAPEAGEASGIFVELAGAGLDFYHLNGKSGQYYMPEIYCGAGALADFDNDGDLDVYLGQGGALESAVGGASTTRNKTVSAPTDRLFRNELQRGSLGVDRLRFTDVSEASGLAVATTYTCGLATGDYDNDGWVDIYVAGFGANRLLRNLGDGTFEDVTAAAGADDPRWSVAAAFVDYDSDGFLDLYVGNYVDFAVSRHKECRSAAGARDYCGPTAYPAVPDRLLRNLGDGSFEDISRSSGIEAAATKTLGVVAADFDSNGTVDFYVASDGLPNQLWLQDGGGKFRDAAALGGCAVNARGQAEASMGVVAEDFDGDGDQDLFMTHLVAETDTLFINNGSALFVDRTISSGLGPPSWPFTSWGIGAVDYDNDGWLDLVVANGAVRTLEKLANAGNEYPFHEPDQVFRNLGGGRFSEVTEDAGAALEVSAVTRGVAIGDLDNDGDSDVLLVANSGPARILVNRVGQNNHWVGLRLVDRDSGRDLLGARAALFLADGRTLWRRAHTDGSYGAGHDPRVLFGIGAQASIEKVRVGWPGGSVEEWPAIAIDAYTTLRRGSGEVLD